MGIETDNLLNILC